MVNHMKKTQWLSFYHLLHTDLTSLLFCGKLMFENTDLSFRLSAQFRRPFTRSESAIPIFITDTIPSPADASALTSTKDVRITTKNSQVSFLSTLRVVLEETAGFL